MIKIDGRRSEVIALVAELWLWPAVNRRTKPCSAEAAKRRPCCQYCRSKTDNRYLLLATCIACMHITYFVGVSYLCSLASPAFTCAG